MFVSAGPTVRVAPDRPLVVRPIRTPITANTPAGIHGQVMRRPLTSTKPSRAKVAAIPRKNTEPPRLLRSLRGDLDWIVMKCLEKDRTRRYETANGLAMDTEQLGHLLASGGLRAGKQVERMQPLALLAVGLLFEQGFQLIRTLGHNRSFTMHWGLHHQ